MKTASLLLLLTALIVGPASGLQDNRYVDYSYTCPLTISCPQVCVSSVEECPLEAQCHNGETLCPDGSCQLFCEESNMESPCKAPCATVACGPAIATVDDCKYLFTEFYDREANCTVKEDDKDLELLESVPTLSLHSPTHIGIIILSVCIMVAVVAWCWFNQVIAPVEGSTKQLIVDDNGAVATQTGYKYHPVGSIIYAGAVGLAFMYVALLVVLVVDYYESPPESDRVKVLMQTIIRVWHVGIAWTFLLHWPLEFWALFLRQCELSEATHVHVVYQREPSLSQQAEKKRLDSSWAMQSTHLLSKWTQRAMYFLYSKSQGPIDATVTCVKFCSVKCNPDGSRYIVFLHRHYDFCLKRKSFAFGMWEVGKTYKDFAKIAAPKEGRSGVTCEEAGSRTLSRGLSDKEVAQRLAVAGRNAIFMPKPSFLRSLFKKIKEPFFSFQVYSSWSWCIIGFWYMIIFWFAIILMALGLVAWFDYRSEKVVYGISVVTGTAKVVRNGRVVDISQKDLVPGDLILLRPGTNYADLVLVHGQATADESAMTGEATPQAKIPIDAHDKSVYNADKDKKRTILAGSKILECEGAVAVVVKTASFTKKGQILMDGLAFRKHTSVFASQLPVAILILVINSVVVWLVTFLLTVAEKHIGWFWGMVAVTSIFPALLPLAFALPQGITFDRLNTNGVACSDASAIVASSDVDRCFFDKTGTLTHQKLELDACRSVEFWNSGFWLCPNHNRFQHAMATCHTLTLSPLSGIIGNQVDRAMFAHVGAKFPECMKTETNNSTNVEAIILWKGQELQVVRRFDFDHVRMCQSVVVRMPDGSVVGFVKGSPEHLKNICSQETLPDEYEKTQRQYASRGMYQIAVGTRVLTDLDWENISRDELECDMNFLGVMYFVNKLKSETKAVIDELHTADIPSIMVTGDSYYTGIHIAREAGIIASANTKVIIGTLEEDPVHPSHHDLVWSEVEGSLFLGDPYEWVTRQNQDVTLAMSGDAWRFLKDTDRPYASLLAPYISVFGRCSPRDKVSVVNTFAELGFKTLMCGDGGNDCGALMAANVGVALGDSEASLVAPFTCLDKNVSAVPRVLKEGRSARESTLAVYKYLIVYGQLTGYMLVYLLVINIFYNDWGSVAFCGMWTVTFSLTLPLANANRVLSKNKPRATFLSWHTVGGITCMTVIDIVFFILAMSMLHSQDWFQCRKFGVTVTAAVNIYFTADSYEACTVFLVVGAQVLFLAASCNLGYEFRRPWWRNYAFVVMWTLFMVIHFHIILVPSKLSCLWRVNCSSENVVRGVTRSEPNPILNAFNTTVMPVEFRWKLASLLALNGVIVIGVEYFLIQGYLRRKWDARSDRALVADNVEVKNEPEEETPECAPVFVEEDLP